MRTLLKTTALLCFSALFAHAAGCAANSAAPRDDEASPVTAEPATESRGALVSEDPLDPMDEPLVSMDEPREPPYPGYPVEPPPGGPGEPGPGEPGYGPDYPGYPPDYPGYPGGYDYYRCRWFRRCVFRNGYRYCAYRFPNLAYACREYPGGYPGRPPYPYSSEEGGEAEY